MDKENKEMIILWAIIILFSIIYIMFANPPTDAEVMQGYLDCMRERGYVHDGFCR